MDTRHGKRKQLPVLETGMDYYRLLQIDHQATSDQITSAYRVAMKRVHPDRVNADRRPEAEDRAKLFNEAFRVLSRPESRRQYDAELKAKAIQEQVMVRYFGGAAAGTENDIYRQLRTAQAAERQQRQQQNNREATVSLFIVFSVFLVIVVVLALLWTAANSFVGTLS